MAKLGTYSYPDIRFGDAVEIAGRVLSKFSGSVTVKGLAWELGMAENSGTLFAKIAALRDFGLVEGRGELRVSDLARRILHPSSPEERREVSIQAFQRVELLRALYERFEGEAPDDTGLLEALEEITKASREEIVRRFTLIQKHLADAARAMRKSVAQVEAGVSVNGKAGVATTAVSEVVGVGTAEGTALCLVAGEAKLTAPLTLEYIDVAINLLRAMRIGLEVSAKNEVVS
ncbi:MAG: hypothetical protein HYU30_02185 [Chloroflexi bacterium]|nr:hypothetical protein [Chloroflexota bacterium]